MAKIWLEIGQVLLGVLINQDALEVRKCKQKETELRKVDRTVGANCFIFSRRKISSHLDRTSLDRERVIIWHTTEHHFLSGNSG